MRKLWTMLLMSTLTMSAVYAQKSHPVGVRMEVAEAETERGEYSIFTYKDADDTFGYYLSVSRSTDTLGTDNVLGFDMSGFREIAIWLGATSDEAMSALASLLDLCGKDVETSAEFRGRAATAGERLGEPLITLCVVTKKPLGGKRLMFVFPHGEHQAHAYLTKSVIKQLRFSFKIDRKLHPKQHQ